ncbi:MAG: DUF4158 domain-containing protein [Burkholderiales bacterium]
MPRRSVLTESERQSLLIIPSTTPEMSKYYLLNESDISVINQKRGAHNKIGFTLLMLCIKFPGISISTEH